MDPNVEITECGPDQREQWDAYVARSPAATVCHQFLWQPIIRRAYGHQPWYLMARQEGRVRGVLPLFLVKSRLFGTSLCSMPFLDYGGPCADDDAVARRLLEEAQRLMQRHRADYVELRQCTPPAQTGPLRLDKVGMRLDLSGGIDAVWKAFPAKTRNQVRKGQKAKLQVRVGGRELLREFYPIFASNMHDLGSPVHHRAFFEQTFEEFGPRARLVLARDGRSAIGGLICLFFKETVTVPWASSLRSYFHHCPNNLLYWEAMQYACAHRYACFDFGRSTVGSGTYEFKRQWMARPVQIYWQELCKNGRHSVAFSSGSPKFRPMLELWKRLPLSLTTLVGPRLRKYLTN